MTQTAFAQIGQIGGPGGIGAFLHGEDSIHDAEFYLVGASHDVTDVTTLRVRVASAYGTMDETDVGASTMSLWLDFDIVKIQGMSVFAQVAQSNFFQDEPFGAETMRNNTFSFGATYRFDASNPGSTVANLGYLENWSALTGSVLE